MGAMGYGNMTKDVITYKDKPFQFVNSDVRHPLFVTQVKFEYDKFYAKVMTPYGGTRWDEVRPCFNEVTEFIEDYFSPKLLDTENLLAFILITGFQIMIVGLLTLPPV